MRKELRRRILAVLTAMMILTGGVVASANNNADIEATISNATTKIVNISEYNITLGQFYNYNLEGCPVVMNDIVVFVLK